MTQEPAQPMNRIETYLQAEVPAETYKHCQQDVAVLLQNDAEAQAVARLHIVISALQQIAAESLRHLLQSYDNIKDLDTVHALFVAAGENHVKRGKATPDALLELIEILVIPVLTRIRDAQEQKKEQADGSV